MSTGHKHNQRRGFTLIEALVSLVFVAIVSVAVMRAMVSSSVAAGEAARQTEAEILLRSLLAQVFAADRVPLGTIRGEMRSHRWAIAGVWENVPIPDDLKKSPWRPERVKVEVDWGVHGRIAAETIHLVRVTP